MKFLFLKEKGLRFFEEAKSDIEKGFYDFSVFHTEQMCQLLIKYLIARRVGEFPRTHKFSLLFEKLAKLYGDDVISFYNENIEIFTMLEESYTGARYSDISFTKELALKTLKFGEKFIKFFTELEKR